MDSLSRPAALQNSSEIPSALTRNRGGGSRIALDGLANTRDLGGMETMDGRRIRDHRLIRSGALAKATNSDIRVLIDEYHVRKVVDFRTREERLESPDPQKSMGGVSFVDIPILDAQSFGITRERGIKGFLDALIELKQDPAALMIEAYSTMLVGEKCRWGYARFFEELLALEDDALLWHCSAGKDRAGLATVLVLAALGVSQDAIRADYLETNRYLRASTETFSSFLAAYHIPHEIGKSLRILNSTDVRFLDAALAPVEKMYGSLPGYLREALGVTDEKREVLRQRYLVKVR
ncbi:MAG: tyrosine-protein phosphatase [Raoultibacter sp.]